MLPPLIGLVGKAGAGKSTVARILMDEHQYKINPFAYALKNALEAMGLPWRNLHDARLKENPLPEFFSRTPRQYMQSLGQWGRNEHPEFWIKMWELRLQQTQEAYHNPRVVADDVRHLNEVHAIKRHKGLIIRVVRDHADTTAHSEHISETELLKHPADFVLSNAGSVDDLRGRLRNALGLIGDTREAAEAV